MRIAFIILIVYVGIALLSFIVHGFLNGRFDQSADPVVDMLLLAIKWPIKLMGLIAALLGR